MRLVIIRKLFKTERKLLIKMLKSFYPPMNVNLLTIDAKNIKKYYFPINL